nr:acyltransferase family protein [Rhizobium sp. L245/93]
MKLDTTYIRSIDGLRAVAVLMVVLFHASVKQMTGGYVGVDAFFVISGFVITRMIVRAVEREDFSYVDFLLRRYARLIPALLVVIFATIAIGGFLQTPRQLLELSKESLAAIFSVSNIFFFLNSGYFDGDAAWKPLLHTWSLGVEEQFYLLWPLLLVGAFKGESKRFAIIGIVILSLASLIAAVWLSSSSPNATFYLTPFRVYQLGLGALIGITDFSLTGRKGSVSAAVGFLALIAAGACFSGNTTVYLAGFCAAAAAALFIIGARSPLAKSAFGNPSMVYIGQRAYSIYLVHWPLIVLARPHTLYVSHSITAPIIVIASFLLGDLLHRFVENPLRLKGRGQARSAILKMPVFAGSLLLQMLLVAVATILIGKAGFLYGDKTDLAAAVQHTRDERGEIGRISDFGRCSLAEGFDNFDPQGCMALSPDKANVALLGDSFGIDTIVALRDEFGSKYNFGNASYAGCAPILSSKTWVSTQKCLDFNQVRFNLIEKQGFKTVILASHWDKAFTADAAETVKTLVSKGMQVYVVGMRAAFDQDVTDLFVKAGSIQDANFSLRFHLTPGTVDLDNNSELPFKVPVEFI